MNGPRTDVHIVEDDESVRDSVQALLESEGIAVRTYDSAPAFLVHADEARGCVLTDIQMPGMDGLRLQDRLNELGLGIPVVIMTGHGDVRLAVRAMKAGAIDFIEKPFSDTQLLAAIRRALSAEQSVRRDTLQKKSAQDMLARLTPRERSVMASLVCGHPNKVAAHQLGISPRTIEIHRAHIMKKLVARNLAEMVRVAIDSGDGQFNQP